MQARKLIARLNDGTPVWQIAGGAGDEDPPGTGDPDPEPTAEDETDWKAEAEKWKSLSRKHEERAKANATAAEKLQEIEEAKKSEQEKLTEAKEAAAKEAADAKREAARLRVALSKGLTETQAKRLVGDTVEELEADADELLADFGTGDDTPPRRPTEDPKPGTIPTSEPEETDPIKLAEAVPRMY